MVLTRSRIVIAALAGAALRSGPRRPDARRVLPPRATEKVTPAQLKSAIDKLGIGGLPDPDGRRPDGAPRRRGHGGAGADRSRRQPRRRLRPLPGAGRALGFQRPAHRRRDAQVARRAQRSRARGRLRAGSSTIRIFASCRGCSTALEREEAEFVRPALTRALAAYGADAKVRQALTGLVMRGQDLFRAVVIEALGEYKAGYALQPIRTWPGSRGRCRTMRCWRSGGSATSAAWRCWPACSGLRSRNLQPSIAAAICLLGSNCGSHVGYLVRHVEVRDWPIPGIRSSCGRRRAVSRRWPLRAIRRLPRRCSNEVVPRAIPSARADRAGARHHRDPQHPASR